jgi:hypothetical protein
LKWPRFNHSRPWLNKDLGIRRSDPKQGICHGLHWYAPRVHQLTEICWATLGIVLLLKYCMMICMQHAYPAHIVTTMPTMIYSKHVRSMLDQPHLINGYMKVLPPIKAGTKADNLKSQAWCRSRPSVAFIR